jgi:hypothetical protein
MAKGIVLGLLYNVAVAVGLVLIAGVRTPESPTVRSSMMLLIAGLMSLPVLGCIAIFSGPSVADLRNLEWNSCARLALGSFLVLVVGEALYIGGLVASNVTTMLLAALAFPAVALVVELLAGKIDPSALTWTDFLGFLLMCAGFVLLVRRS